MIFSHTTELTYHFTLEVDGFDIDTEDFYENQSPASPSRSIPTDSPPSSSFPPRTPRPLPSASYVTETVFGFLDFVTTVGDTVMVFTPANAGKTIVVCTL